MEKYYKTLLNNDSYKKALKTEKSKGRVEKDKQKVEMVDERDERKKTEFFGNKDFVYDEYQ